MSEHGCLYVVATPIGNLGDISQRAIDTLGSVEIILAERPSHSKKLLNHLNIAGCQVLPYQDQNEQKMTQLAVSRLKGGSDIALISDAGTPLVSDPGYRLIQQIHLEGLTVKSVPGPCALISALSIAGIAMDRFIFLGFLPAREHARKEVMQRTDELGFSFAYYESPHRLLRSIQALKEVVGKSRKVAVVKELTKINEYVLSASSEVVEQYLMAQDVIKGEWVILVEGAPVISSEYPKQLAVDMAAHVGASVTSKLISEHYNVSKNKVYQDLLNSSKMG